MRIVIIEDHLMFREVLRKVCTSDLHHEVAGEAADGRTGVEQVLATKPDLVLLDLHLPNLDGFGVIEAVRQAVPNVRILVLSSHCDDYTVFRVERALVQGFVDKNTNTVAALKAAITAIGEGRTHFSEPFQRIKLLRRHDLHSFDKLLSDRERAIVTLVGEALGDAAIAARLGISRETAEKHRHNTIKKLGLQNTTELIRYAREHGFTLSAPSDSSGALLP